MIVTGSPIKYSDPMKLTVFLSLCKSFHFIIFGKGHTLLEAFVTICEMSYILYSYTMGTNVLPDVNEPEGR